jgi:putative membrane protein
MKKTSLIFFAAFGVLAFSSCEKKTTTDQQAQQDTTAQAPEQKKELSNNDKDFIMETATDGMLEVELGKLAHEKAVSKEVKDFGHHMMMDHEKASNELKQLAAQKNVMLSDSLDSDAKNKKEDLAKLKGNEFDKKYVSEMVKEHKKEIEKFEDIANKSEDPELKAWAQQTLPTLQSHYMEAQKLDSMMSSNKKKSGKTSMK